MSKLYPDVREMLVTGINCGLTTVDQCYQNYVSHYDLFFDMENIQEQMPAFDRLIETYFPDREIPPIVGLAKLLRVYDYLSLRYADLQKNSPERFHQALTKAVFAYLEAPYEPEVWQDVSDGTTSYVPYSWNQDHQRKEFANLSFDHEDTVVPLYSERVVLMTLFDAFLSK